MHRYLHRIALAAVLMLPAMYAAVAPAASLYDVEIIIFTNNSDTDQGETPGISGDSAGRGMATGNRFTDLSSRQFRLGPVSYSLQQGGNYTVLLHRAWRQPASAGGAYPVRASAGGSSVEGGIRLTRGRYLHLDVDLLLRDAGGAGYASSHRLAEKRRMRSNDLHYFDHPRFGMLAMITPYQPAEQPAQPEPDAAQPAVPTSP